MIRRSVMIGLGVTALLAPMWGQNRKENWKRCVDRDPAVNVAACTALIESGNEKPKNLGYAYNDRGIAYFAQEKYGPAVADFNQALRLVPAFATDIIFLIHRGIAHMNDGENDLAIADYNVAIHLRPLVPDSYNDRGNAYINKGQFDLAIADFNVAISLKPDYAYAFANRGLAYTDKGQFERGIEDYNSAVRLKPDYAPTFASRCNARAVIGQLDLALLDCDHALSLSPAYTDTLGYRGLAHLKMGKYDLAIADYDAALKNKSKPPAAWLYGRGLAKKRTGDAAGAATDIAAATKVDAGIVNQFVMWGVPAT